MLRSFEKEIIERIRSSPRYTKGIGGRSVSRKGLWIKGHLRDAKKDYVHSMFMKWKSFVNETGLEMNPGTYEQFRTYIYLLKQSQLIETTIGKRGNKPFERSYYIINHDMLTSPLWLNPFKIYG